MNSENPIHISTVARNALRQMPAHRIEMPKGFTDFRFTPLGLVWASYTPQMVGVITLGYRLDYDVTSAIKDAEARVEERLQAKIAEQEKELQTLRAQLESTDDRLANLESVIADMQKKSPRFPQTVVLTPEGKDERALRYKEAYDAEMQASHERIDARTKQYFFEGMEALSSRRNQIVSGGEG